MTSVTVSTNSVGDLVYSSPNYYNPDNLKACFQNAFEELSNIPMVWVSDPIVNSNYPNNPIFHIHPPLDLQKCETPWMIVVVGCFKFLPYYMASFQTFDGHQCIIPEFGIHKLGVAEFTNGKEFGDLSSFDKLKDFVIQIRDRVLPKCNITVPLTRAFENLEKLEWVKVEKTYPSGLCRVHRFFINILYRSSKTYCELTIDYEMGEGYFLSIDTRMNQIAQKDVLNKLPNKYLDFEDLMKALKPIRNIIRRN